MDGDTWMGTHGCLVVWLALVLLGFVSSGEGELSLQAHHMQICPKVQSIALNLWIRLLCTTLQQGHSPWNIWNLMPRDQAHKR